MHLVIETENSNYQQHCCFPELLLKEAEEQMENFLGITKPCSIQVIKTLVSHTREINSMHHFHFGICVCPEPLDLLDHWIFITKFVATLE